MPWQYTAYTVLLFTTTGVLVVLVRYARLQHAVSGRTEPAR
jgi:hypothetical protein